jgi:hypothetical protein
MKGGIMKYYGIIGIVLAVVCVFVAGVMAGAVATQKQQFFADCQDTAEVMAWLKIQAKGLNDRYYDNTFHNGGALAVVDGDFTGTQWEGRTAAELGSLITQLNDFAAWYDAAGRDIAVEKWVDSPGLD